MLRLICRDPEGNDWGKPAGMADALYRLLRARGIASDAQARAYLRPLDTPLLDPYALYGMERAVSRIRAAIGKGERICVWGDYDVDGVSATVILETALRRLGAKVAHHIPTRHDEGYGLNDAWVAKLAESCDLLITVDCGVASNDLIARAMQNGLDFIVTDHHRPGDALPDCPVVHPQLGEAQNPNLCGAGVAFKLALALTDGAAMDLIDLAALATVADVVSLTGENRAIVARGLRAMQCAPRPGIAALIDASGIDGKVLRASHIAFQLAPRLNASGRIDSAEAAYALLTAETLDAAAPIAASLEAENQRRKQLEAAILDGAGAQLRDYDFMRYRVIVLAGAGWNPGVAGLAASRLTERWGVPSVVLCEADGALTGSARSVEGVDIYEALRAASPYLTRFGGHKQAAGMTLPKENLEDFREALNRAIIDNSDPEAFVPALSYDIACSLDEIDQPLVESLEDLQPFGMGNPAPAFLTECVAQEARAIGRDGAHLKLTLESGEGTMEGRWWRNGGKADALRGRALRVVYAPIIDNYRNRLTLQMDVKGVARGGDVSALCPDDARCRAHLHDFLTDKFYNKKNCSTDFGAPTGAGLAAIRDALAVSPFGTLVAVTDPAILRALLDALPPDRYDLYLGRWPDDPRGFNAVCLLPLGAPPPYPRLFTPDAPAGLFTADAHGGGFAPWMQDLPDRDALRDIYVAMRALLSKPYAARSVPQLMGDIARGAGVDPLTAHAGCCVLNDMGLIDFRPDPIAVSLLPARKVAPETSDLYQMMNALRAFGGADV